MKKIFSILILSAIAVIAAFSLPSNMKTSRSTPDSQGHVLTSLWKEADAFRKADMPLKQLAVLERIRDEAAAKRLHKDFYDAATEAFGVAVSRNWKDSERLEKDLERRIDEYDEPIVTFFRRSGEGYPADSILASESRLRTGRNTAFYTGFSLPDGAMEDVVISLVKDDFEYCLWMVCSENEAFDPEGKAFRALRTLCSGRYPLEEYLDYRKSLYRIPYGKSMEECLRFAGEHRGQAVRLLALGEYVTCLKDSLDRADAASPGYEDLLSLCREYEEERKTYRSGTDRLIATQVKTFENMIGTLKAKALAVEFERDTVRILARNLRSVTLTLKTDERKPVSFFRTTVSASGDKLYAPDTIEVVLPGIDDGDYLVELRSGNVKRESRYSRRSLSIASRKDAEMRNLIYIADSQTGEPLAKADLECFRSGELRSTAKDFALDGFTPLPDSFRDSSGGPAANSVVASFRGPDGFLRKSPELWLTYGEFASSSTGETSAECSIFTDKAAYKPGETLRFKAVLYQARTDGSSVVGQGCPVSVSLKDAEGKEAASADLVTNEYGSVAGDFLLPAGRRNGRYRLEVSFTAPGDSRPTMRSRTVVVDEFVLPDYVISFEPSDGLFLSGDTVAVRGSVVSFTGHKVAAASATYEVREYSRTILSGTLALGDDGSFEIRFPSASEGSGRPYSVTVRVADATGETIENSRSVFVQGTLYPSVEILNESGAQARVSAQDWSDVRTVSGPEALVRFSITNPEGKPVALPVSYTLIDPEGRVSASGSGKTGETVTLELPSAGAYSLKMDVKAVGRSGRTISASRQTRLLRFDDSASTLDAPFEHVFSLVGPCRDGSLRPGEDIHLKVGAGDGPVWMLVELFGDRKQLLEKRLVFLEGVSGKEGSVADVMFDCSDEYPEGLFLNVFYFRKGRSFSYSKTFVREREMPALPLSFSRFVDRTLPGARYGISLSTDPDAEVVAAVFDKSSEAFGANVWNRSFKPVREVASVSVRSGCGFFSGENLPLGYDSMTEDVAIVYGKPSGRPLVATKSSVAMNDRVASAPDVVDSVVEESSAVSYDDASVSATGPVRSDFSTSLAFEPFLRPDSDGNISFDFETSDRLSTFVVQVYAHDKSMRDTLVRKEFVVSLPVRLSVVQPDYLYRGDRLTLHAALNSLSGKPVDGTVTLSLFSSGDYRDSRPFRTYSKKVTVPAGAALPLSFDLKPADGDSLGILLSFAGNGAETGEAFSDCVFVTVPVKEDCQVITESHSAVLLPGADRDVVLKQLRERFTGISSYGAEYSETDIRAMLLDALPAKVDPERKDVLSVTEAIYVRKVAASLGADVSGECTDEELMNMLASCRNADGGFGWFPGMKSSPALTAAVLERYSRLCRLGLAAGRSELTAGSFDSVSGGSDPGSAGSDSVSGGSGLTAGGSEPAPGSFDSVPGGSEPALGGFDPAPSVRYLDNTQFLHGRAMPFWSGLLSWEQYMHVRSLYPEIGFDVSSETASGMMAVKENLKEFKTFASRYLTPSARDGRGLQGLILQKARRIATLLNLASSRDGKALASAWGITFGTGAKLRKSLEADVLSLVEYAVSHPSGGWYYPDAVMPQRGLLENELYAHTILCDIFDDEYVRKVTPSAGLPTPSAGLPTLSAGLPTLSAGLPTPSALADGIRLWIMLQKETQDWDTDPAFVDAVGVVLRGGDSVLGTRVVSLTKTYRSEISGIKAAGNGFSIERRFYREIPATSATSGPEATSGAASPASLASGGSVSPASLAGGGTASGPAVTDGTSTASSLSGGGCSASSASLAAGVQSGSAAGRIREEISEGTELAVGDKIIAEYRVSSDENRSFVRLSAPREASFRPVDQLSRNYGWWLGVIRLDGSFSITPQGYRNVKSDRTEYYFDVYPEDKTVIREEFFVTQEGTFKAPVVTIESLYAPHYRANDGFRSSVRTKFMEKVK
ncbi:MAG: MG2 domain-containing protein [Bacteroidales bacterium]|nr:MG2 domain-containing protein [Bacteroidales bacterium]